MNPNQSQARVERLLASWRGGDATALDSLLETCYRELLKQAKKLLRQTDRRSLVQPGDLVHQTYLRLRRLADPDFANGNIFFGFATEQMRQVLIDLKRVEKAKKRGGDVTIVSLHISERQEDR